MTDTIIHNGDLGTTFLLTITESDGTTAVDVSTATKLQMIFLDPDGVSTTKTAALNTTGTDGKIKYVSEAGLIDVSGTWQVQGYVEFGGGTSKYYSSAVSFLVEDNLA